MLDVGDRLVQQQTDVLIVQVVDHPAPVPEADDEAEMSQDSQLVGNRRSLHAHVGGQIGHGARTGTQPAENLYPAARRQRLHRLGDGGRSLAIQFISAEGVVTV